MTDVDSWHLHDDWHDVVRISEILQFFLLLHPICTFAGAKLIYPDQKPWNGAIKVDFNVCGINSLLRRNERVVRCYGFQRWRARFSNFNLSNFHFNMYISNGLLVFNITSTREICNVKTPPTAEVMVTTTITINWKL